MKLKFYVTLLHAVCVFLPTALFSQLYDCDDLMVSYSTKESRCTATGSITVVVTGGSGNYNYKVTGPVTTLPTSSNLITGLPPGTYSLTVDDIVSECSKNITGIVIGGSYTDPGFGLSATDLTCYNGNDGSVTVNGIANGRSPFQFKIIAPSASSVGTTNSTGIFTNLTHGDYYIEMRDSCGGIQTRNITVQNYDWSIQSRTVVQVNCDSTEVTVNLIDNKGNVNTEPATHFAGFTYGAVKSPGDTIWSTTKQFRVFLDNFRQLSIVAKDRCGNVKATSWFETNFPRVSYTCGISNQTCNTFTVYIRNPRNLTNPQYCLLTAANTIVECNSTGTFNNVPYGTYSIKVTDNCYDTSFVRTVTQGRLVPSLGTVTGGSFTCNSFTATVNSQYNVTDPQFCIYDSSNNLVGCNTTGVFPGLAFGSYCIKMTNNTACYDTTIERCFNMRQRVPSIAGTITISNRACKTFTATAGGQTDLTNPQFCLYNSTNTLITCNTTGVFDNLPYGSYCIKMTNDPLCYDTIITRCFTENIGKPYVTSEVTIGTKYCTGYNFAIYSYANLTNPQFCAYNSANELVTCNTNGVFYNMPFGSYTIRIVNDAACYDTTIIRSVSADPDPVDLVVNQRTTCQQGITQFHPYFNAGIAPYTVNVYDPAGNLVQSNYQWSYYFTFQLPVLAPGLSYKFVGTDSCGKKDSVEAQTLSYRVINKSVQINKRCPGGSTPNGSSDLVITATNNEGTVTPSIIKKNGASVTINYTVSSGNTYTFSSLEPANYIVQYNYQYTYSWGEVCNNSIYDTIAVAPYMYPNLGNSSAYQCDNNSFSVSGAASSGVAPYTYEIIGSVPALPSIATATQANPVFAISNGVKYDLVRLRAIDACGNATLGDVSVLPMANLIVGANGNCYYNNINLTVRDIPNAAYTWYKKTSETDSVELVNARTYSIVNLLPTDTGMYVCKTVVNNGCLIRLNYKHITGNCYAILDNEKFVLSATKQPTSVELKWAKAAGQMVNKFIVERQVKGSNNYVQIGIVEAGAASQVSFYQFTDDEPENGIMYYRIKVIAANGAALYSNVVSVTFNSPDKISVFPNPVTTKFVVTFNNTTTEKFNIELVNMSGQSVMKKEMFVNANGTVTLLRNQNWGAGMYLLKITGQKSSNTESKLIKFE